MTMLQSYPSPEPGECRDQYVPTKRKSLIGRFESVIIEDEQFDWSEKRGAIGELLPELLHFSEEEQNIDRRIWSVSF